MLVDNDNDDSAVFRSQSVSSRDSLGLGSDFGVAVPNRAIPPDVRRLLFDDVEEEGNEEENLAPVAPPPTTTKMASKSGGVDLTLAPVTLQLLFEVSSNNVLLHYLLTCASCATTPDVGERLYDDAKRLLESRKERIRLAQEQRAAAEDAACAAGKKVCCKDPEAFFKRNEEWSHRRARKIEQKRVKQEKEACEEEAESARKAVMMSGMSKKIMKQSIRNSPSWSPRRIGAAATTISHSFASHCLSPDRYSYHIVLNSASSHQRSSKSPPRNSASFSPSPTRPMPAHEAALASGERVLSPHDVEVLTARLLAHEDRKRESVRRCAAHVEAERMKECTFHPNIISARNCDASKNSMSVFDRLTSCRRREQGRTEDDDLDRAIHDDLAAWHRELCPRHQTWVSYIDVEREYRKMERALKLPHRPQLDVRWSCGSDKVTLPLFVKLMKEPIFRSPQQSKAYSMTPPRTHRTSQSPPRELYGIPWDDL